MFTVTTIAVIWWNALPKSLFKEPLSTVLYSREGMLLGAQVADDGQWRFPSAKVPKRFEQALIAYEDKRFYGHHGIDLAAIARALALDIRHRRIVSGGSTLTMQTVRLARGREGSRIVDKITEMWLAPRLELSYSKAQILSLYAANAPFGGNVIGLEAAAWRYFGRSPEQLSWAEACTLAVLPNSPATVHLNRQRALLKKKRDALLQRLYERHELDNTQLELALSEPLIDAPTSLPQVAPHLLATLQRRSPIQHRFDSTIDASLQHAVNDTVVQHSRELAKQDIRNVAAIVVDNRTFEVLAYVGNSQWSLAPTSGYALDIVQRPRSTGSILKPLLYAAMLESGELAPRMLIADIPTQYGGYMPENYDRTYRGAVPADVALAQSLNVPAVRMLREFGVARFYDLLQKLQFTTLVRAPDDYGLSLILGGAEGTLWEITQAHANLVHLARDGANGKSTRYRQATLLLKEPLASTDESDIGPASAWLTLRALTEVTRPGEESHWRNFSSSREIAWKTGTSWGLRDAWAIGSTSRYTVGVWVGNASGEGRPGLIGGVAAAPIMFSIFQYLPTSPNLAPPLWAMKSVFVCKNDGALANAECETERQWLPRNSHFNRISSHNVRVHLDASGQFRVDSDCESIVAMTHRSWFVLPPAQEYYYRRAHSDYRSLPPFRRDCKSSFVQRSAIDFLYPAADTRVYIPFDFGAQRGRVVLEAVHRDRNAALYWYIDDRYLGSTRLFHTQAVDLEPGVHVVTVVDQNGERAVRRFEVLGLRTSSPVSDVSHSELAVSLSDFE